MSPPPPVVLMLPGQGSQYPGMLHGLYEHEPVFTRVMDEVFELLGDEGKRIRADWLSDRPGIGLDDVRRAQPLIFAIDVALGTMLGSWGVRPAALVGHSAGEYAAAVLAGIMSLSDATAALAARVSTLATAPAGGMVAVAASPAQLAPWLTTHVVVGAVNAPNQVMISGPEPELTDVTGRFTDASVTWMRVKAGTGFHSPSVEPACAATVVAYRNIRYHAPNVPLVSACTGRELAEPLLSDPVFWAMQPARPVYFGPALSHLLDGEGTAGPGPFLLVEAGPGQGLSMVARRHRAVTRGGSAVVALGGLRPDAESDRRQLADAARRIEAHGHVLGPGAPHTAPVPVTGDPAPGGRQVAVASST